MGEVINFNKARKDRDRAAAKTEAAENRARSGQTKAAKTARKAETDKAARALDQVKRED